MRRGPRRAPLTAVVLLAACYRYAPTPGGDPLATGAEVRVALSPEGAARLAPVLGAGTTAIEGRVAGASDTAYVFAVSATRKASASDRVVWAGESVTVPRAAIAGTERRSLDKGRTGLAAGLAVAGAVLLKLALGAIGSSSGGTDGPGPIVTPP